MQKLIIGNWKMNGLQSWKNKVDMLVKSLSALRPTSRIILCPPATLISSLFSRKMDAEIQIGGQDCHTDLSGAFTGEISAEMLKDAGASFVILGHSERRGLYGETDIQIARKMISAFSCQLSVILCVGESLEQKESGYAIKAVLDQLINSLNLPEDSKSGISGNNLIIAYEPVWAIGTGKIPTREDIKSMHSQIRVTLMEKFGNKKGREIPVLYGGSINSGNAREIFTIPEVNGGLIGGASLDMESFMDIITIANESI